MTDSDTTWDVAVVGAGIAGLTAARTAAEHGLRVVAFDMLAPGGQLINLGEVTGYPGLPGKTGGPDLAGTLLEEAMAAGVEISYAEVTGLAAGPPVTVDSLDGPVTAGAVVVTTGLAPGRLGVPGEDDWAGRGLSECASCDGPLFAGQRVAVVGDDGWAAQEAAELAAVAGHVTVLAPGAPRWSARAADRLSGLGVEVREGAVVAGLGGDTALTGVLLADDGEVPATGVFAATGRAPRSAFLDGVVGRDPDGRVTGDPATGVPGVFAAGDVRAGSVDHLVAAAADGLRAGLAAVAHLHSPSSPSS
ncbi:NAD(P)/FAD-dependent oxidoreductase [Pseudonocardia sp. KRD291]|uniref:NAD(P)/FAD-dependent oxidoreductase n=1 Tax=Pseudonocardia sp. KRD291 TaxID=2792007 RepID=UPI001C4A7458|nr:NAD(P)/FAD-dependent oxidoreductase [Pseudonocardia sp. KRD291]MBW0104277.1 FAD-dependent oxidoreductase [Pseudonocardia sp. KRD291]